MPTITVIECEMCHKMSRMGYSVFTFELQTAEETAMQRSGYY